MVNITSYFLKLVQTSRVTSLVLLSGFLYFTSVPQALAFTVNVKEVGALGTAVTGFRWTLQEDTTQQVDPGTQTQVSISLTFHKSNDPVIASGECDAASCDVTVPDPAKNYFISVLPYVNSGDLGHNIGGVKVLAGATAVDVLVTQTPLPTARIRVLVFHDNAPINGAPDFPGEANDPTFDPTQFTVILEDAGGRYGQTGGHILQDVFGNPLGTTYNAADEVVSIGNGVLTPGANGELLINNIAPGKYGIQVIAPDGAGWIQTSTLEGSKTIDAFVKANEPEFFTEFGQPGPHVFVGFVKATNDLATFKPDVTTRANIQGTIVGNHLSRPPVVEFNPAGPIGGCWVGLSESVAGIGTKALYAQPCNADSTFNIPSVPAGTYTLSIWDENLGIVIAQRAVTITTGALQDLGDLMVFQWFGRLDSVVFFDTNENGFRDAGELPMLEVPVSLRFRNGTTYQSFPTDTEGAAPFDEVFPFFHWLVAEVDFSRFKATGVTYMVDAGGALAADEALNPQIQVGGLPSRTLTGPVLTLGMQVFLGNTNVIEWGKANYGPGENGGISGMALYAITRAEDDPAYTAAEEWEPGIPRVQMALYQDADNNDIIDDVNGVVGVQLADEDNHPRCWTDPSICGSVTPMMGPEDVDNITGTIATTGIFNYGDAIQVTSTDSWDDSIPTGCVPNSPAFVAHAGTPIEHTPDCYDGLRNFNQIREAVYDGGYAFDSTIVRDGTGAVTYDAFGAPVEIDGLPGGYYIVQAATPPGYEIVKEEDKNVDFGVDYIPDPLLLPPTCVGDNHVVPPYLSFQTSRTLLDAGGNPAALAGIAAPDLIDAPFAGTTVKLCDRKKVILTAGKNAAADFFLFTDTPIGAHVVGVMLNDLANEFDPANPNFGEKFAPSWLPVSFKDWTGQEIVRVYSDEFGKFEAILPSTFSVNLPHATGVSPNMLTACMNDASPIPNPAWVPADPTSERYIVDPNYNPQYSQFCYTFQYMPGSTTYLDTPVVPVAAFASQGTFPVDCEAPTLTPVISRVDGPGIDGGPFIDVATGTSRQLVIRSAGSVVEVLNPDFPNSPNSKVARDYSFGTARGAVKIGSRTMQVDSWAANEIVANVPADVAPGEYQLMVTRSTGETSKTGITVTLGDIANVSFVSPSADPAATPIQDAIELASPGGLIIVKPGTYFEMVVMHKPVKLQGSGAWTTVINAVNFPGNKLADWRTKVSADFNLGKFDVLPGQAEPLLALEEAAGITVFAHNDGSYAANNARIDGLTIKGATQGGGILVNGYAAGLQISNNRVTGNQGSFSGGIRVGHPQLTFEIAANEFIHTYAANDNVSIHHNDVILNGALGGAGGGISLYNGADNYSVVDNMICGNFTQGHGAGIGHSGWSDGGMIAGNRILFNQSFNQGLTKHGGGIFISGIGGLAVQDPRDMVTTPPNYAGGLTNGAGTVTIDSNLISGNHAGSGHGGGIITAFVNGADVAENTGWYAINITNNMIVNNVAGNTGAGIALKDTANAHIINNTIAYNDSTATDGRLIIAGVSTAQPGAGIASLDHSAVLAADSGQTYSDPELVNDIIWNNRSFYFDTVLLECTAANTCTQPDELHVLNVTGSLNPVSSLLTDATAYPGMGNTTGDPLFISAFPNVGRGTVLFQGEPTAFTQLEGTAAFDEGGNFIDVQYGPLTYTKDYHIDLLALAGPSPAIDSGAAAGPVNDFDGNNRPTGAGVDIGADETVADFDGDGIDDDLDNCVNSANAHQFDSNDDGYGNICDADINNDGVVSFGDYGVLRLNFGSATFPDADLNNDGVVSFGDYGILRLNFGNAPGPSGIAP